jgi:5-methylcytosine-specific restriction endonuclease McrA
MPLSTMADVKARSNATPLDLVVFLAIADTMGGDPQRGFTSMADIMRHTRLSESYIREAITRIEALDELRIDGGLSRDPAATQLYHVLIADPPPRGPRQPRTGHPPIPAKDKLAVMRADDFTCQGCRKAGGDLTVDLIVAWDNGGEIVRENMQTLCRSCNSRKGNR